MARITSLKIPGYKKIEVPNTFVSQPNSKKAVLILPGMGYNCQMPLLYYSTMIALTKGYDVLCLDYSYAKRASPETPEEELYTWLCSDVEEGYTMLKEQKSYSEIVIISKSLGTKAAAHLISSKATTKIKRVVWLTPLLNDKKLMTEIIQNSHRINSLFVSGSSDPHFNLGQMQKLAKIKSTCAIVIDGADHRLEIKNDINASLQSLSKVMSNICHLLS